MRVLTDGNGVSHAPRGVLKNVDTGETLFIEACWTDGFPIVWFAGFDVKNFTTTESRLQEGEVDCMACLARVP